MHTVPDMTVYFVLTQDANLEGDINEIYADMEATVVVGTVHYSCTPTSATTFFCHNLAHFTMYDHDNDPKEGGPDLLNFPEIFDAASGTATGVLGPGSGIFAGVNGYFSVTPTEVGTFAMDMYFE